MHGRVRKSQETKEIIILVNQYKNGRRMMHHAWIDEVEHYCLEFKEWYAVKKAAAAF